MLPVLPAAVIVGLSPLSIFLLITLGAVGYVKTKNEKGKK